MHVIPDRLVALLLAAGAGFSVVAAQADDVQVVARTSFDAHQERVSGGEVVRYRRRLVERVGADWSRDIRVLGTRQTPGRASASIDLRIDQDFGETCDPDGKRCFRPVFTNAPETYQPLAVDSLVDLPAAHLDVVAPRVRTELRVGRWLRFDPLGIARVDGAQVRVEPVRTWTVEAWGGTLVRRTTFGGSAVFEPEGNVSLDLPPDYPASRAPWVRPELVTWVAGGASAWQFDDSARVRMDAREVRDSEDIVSRRVGATLDWQPGAPFDADLGLAWDAVMEEFDDAGMHLRWSPDERWRFAAGAEHHRPRFDAGTIWAYFASAPVSDATAGVQWQAARRVGLRARVRGRRADLQSAGPVEHGGAIELGGTVRFGAARVSCDATGWGGDLGARGSGRATVDLTLGPKTRASLYSSAWQFEDPTRPDLHGTSLSQAAAFEYAFSENTRARAEIEYSHNRVVGERFRAFAFLDLEVLR